MTPGEKYDDFYDCPQWDGTKKSWLPPSKLKTHRQLRCVECGFFHIWVPRENRRQAREAQ